MLKQADPGMTIVPNGSQEECWDAYFWIADADAFFAEMKASGAAIEYAPCIQVYAMKEFAVRDPDGYILAFGQHWEEPTDETTTRGPKPARAGNGPH